MSDRGGIYVISGPSGVGKSTVLGKLFHKLDRYFFSISATTRAPRAGETDGREYYFISKEKFMSMLEEGALLEHAEYAGNYYGTPIEPILRNAGEGTDVFLDVEVKGRRQVCDRLPEAVSVFIAPPDVETLENRLRSRGTESEEKIRRRLEIAQQELEHIAEYDHVVINDSADRAAEELFGLITSYRTRGNEL